MSAALLRVCSSIAALPVDDVDTDQIIPGRFLTTTARVGLGRYLFHDWRVAADGQPRADFVLLRPEARGARVLVAGRNFGCGSSREHAAWALVDHGFQAVIAISFADIFRRNALKNGLVPVAVPAPVVARLLDAPSSTVVIDIEALELRLDDGLCVPFTLPPFARYCLLQGVDELAFLSSHQAAVEAYEATRTAFVSGGQRS
jgi:3-isopropylmalate/(R)-2-methylmalate dehydratase small subunit